MSARRVLVAESDALARWPMAERLRAAGFDVVDAHSAAEALAHVADGLDVAIVEDGLFTDDGRPALTRAAALDPDLTLIAIRRSESPPPGNPGPRVPAFESLVRPVAAAALIESATRGADVTRLRRDLKAAREAAAAPAAIVGESAAIVRVRALVERYATSPESPVLITGETGAGKRVVARRLHEAGARSASPVVFVAGGALAAEALERALFGADASAGRLRRAGALETARDGTLVLTSVESLPLELQARLLEVLEARAFRRTGGTRDVATGARVIATTTADLASRVRGGQFRRDLFHRVSALRVDVPPLRARREDIPALARHLARQLAEELDWPEPDDILASGPGFDRHDWPGNVRELQDLVRHAMSWRTPGTRDAVDLENALSARLVPAVAGGLERDFTLPPEGISLDAVERALVIQALARTGGNQTKAAALLSLHRDQMRYRIEKFGLKT